MVEALIVAFLLDCVLILTYMGYILVREDRIREKKRKGK